MRASILRASVVVLFSLFLAVPRAQAAAIGVLGDSLGAEYQFAEAPRPGARNYVELLALFRGLDFGDFSTASRGEPRLEGYEYNWANAAEFKPGGVVGTDLFAMGQVQGLAGQVAGGLVDTVYLTIGGNDFRGIAVGGDPNVILTDLFTSTVGAVQALKAANPNVRIVIANVVDITKVPAAQQALIANPALAANFAMLDGATAQYNANLAGFFAADPNVAIADINAVLDTLLVTQAVNGQPIDTLNPGFGPGHLFVDEIHPGTVGSAFIANAFVDASNTRFGTTISPFGQAEMLRIAAAPLAVPLPAAAWIGIACVPLVLRSARRIARRAQMT